MRSVSRSVVCVVLGLVLTLGVTACGNDSAEEPTTDESTAEQSADEASATVTGDDIDAEPLTDEQRYVDLIAAGLDFSYDLTTDDGTLEVWQNEESYGVMRWSDDEQREIIVTRRYIEGEPEEWVYADSGVVADAVTDVAPTGAQLQAYDALAEDIVAATGATGELTRVYAWTAKDGQGICAYSTKGVTDDPNLTIYLGPAEQVSRIDFVF